VKNDILSENDDTEVKNKEDLETILKTRKAKVTARADEVKAIEKTLELPPHFATMFNIFILTFTIFILTYNIFIFNPFVSAYHVQRFTIGDLSDCKAPCLSRPTNSAQAKATVKALANTSSIRLFKVPEKQPDPRSRNLHRNLLVPRYLLSGQIRKSENDLYHDSFILHYLDPSR
jgi:hypothetical protein